MTFPDKGELLLGQAGMRAPVCRGRPFQTEEYLARVYEAELPLQESPPNLARSNLLYANVTFQSSRNQNQQITMKLTVLLMEKKVI